MIYVAFRNSQKPHETGDESKKKSRIDKIGLRSRINTGSYFSAN